MFWSRVTGRPLHPEDEPGDPEVQVLLAEGPGLGATFVADHRNPDGSGWAVLADPEGNEFCVLRSESDRAAMTS
ncbi:VOC family protein [Streptomyces sp. NPDC050355]|uniref:VOC family protein n=1 Tax=Streptomyces sp. NPDC050355 TaxID=3365609 RepID=UPI0037951515